MAEINDWTLYALIGQKARIYDSNNGKLDEIGVIIPAPPDETRAKYGLALRRGTKKEFEIFIFNLHLEKIHKIDISGELIEISMNWSYGHPYVDSFLPNSPKAKCLDYLLTQQRV